MPISACFRGVAVCLFMMAVGCAARIETWEQVTAKRPPTSRPAQVLPTPVWQAQGDPYINTPGYEAGDGARVGEGFDLAMRNPDYPRTHIAEVHIDLTSPGHWVRIVWAGPMAPAMQDAWRSSVGRGLPGCHCDEVEQSNQEGSHCTPKGVFRVKGFSDHLLAVPGCLYATWVVHEPRYIAIHSSGDIPPFPASGGCIRLPHEAAKLIHNNAIAGVTLIHIAGQWTRGGVTRAAR